MFGAHDESEITFYEELGVAPDASPQEIRDAFHGYARLLHPDQQTDPVLREIAEKQMRKLNRVYAVLSDPDRRREYDEVIGTPPTAIVVNNAPPSGSRRVMAKLPWVAAIVVSAAVLIWLAYDATPASQRSVDPATVQTAAPAVAATSPTTATEQRPRNQSSDAAQIAHLQSELNAAIERRDAAEKELASLRGIEEKKFVEASPAPAPRPAEIAPPPPTQVTITELPSSAKVTPSLPPAPARIEQRQPNRKLTGFWFYAKPAEGQKNKNQALYLPEYIEATITDDGGTIHGRYRSRFLIADRAIPPDVNFTFSGTTAGTQCNCTWTGSGGAKGDLTLKLTGDNSLKIDWVASEMGNLGLGSGTATLTRKIE